MSMYALRRMLYSMGLMRKNIIESDKRKIVFYMVKEMFATGFNLGYRLMWQRLLIRYNLIVKRDTVYNIIESS